MKLFKFWVNGTRKVKPDDDKVIPWIAASKLSDQKLGVSNNMRNTAAEETCFNIPVVKKQTLLTNST